MSVSVILRPDVGGTPTKDLLGLALHDVIVPRRRKRGNLVGRFHYLAFPSRIASSALRQFDDHRT